jgi:RimJ/RimL family protein N-acetyltransferase
MPLPHLRGDLINLRQLRRSDSSSIQRYANNRRISKYVTHLPYPYLLCDARKWINTSHRLLRTGRGYHFGIEGKENGTILGCVGLNNINLRDKNAEVGYWLGVPFWGKGYTSEAVKLIVGYSFQDLRLRRVYAIVHCSNLGSIRVLRRSGFRREGTFREACLMSGRWSDVYFYGLLKEEFRF